MNDQDEANEEKAVQANSALPISEPSAKPSLPLVDPLPNDNQARERISKSDKIMIAATIVIALGTVVSAVAIALQWQEMVGGGKQTDKIIAAAQENARAAKSFSTSAESINKGLANAVDKLAQQASDSETFFRTDERAWVEIGKIDTKIFPPDSTFGTTFKYGILLKNDGKTVAKDVRILIQNQYTWATFDDNKRAIKFVQDDLAFHPGGRKRDMIPDNPGPQTLAPGELSTVPVYASGQEPRRYGNDFMYAFVLGKIDYKDAFDENHWMRFCYIVMNATGDLGHCTYGNNEDGNAEIPRRINQK